METGIGALIAPNAYDSFAVSATSSRRQPRDRLGRDRLPRPFQLIIGRSPDILYTPQRASMILSR
jgi:hypothetical protein